MRSSAGVSPPTKIVHIGSTSVMAEVADTPASIESGLSGRASLREGRGMLFVYNAEYRWGVWMKDTRFPTDIMWADVRGTIVAIARDVSPATLQRAYWPPQPARYVFEVPAGFVATHDIAEGMKIVMR